MKNFYVSSICGKTAKSVILAGMLMISFFAGKTQTTIPSGSFIINMGITPQTVNNGLHPYGLVYYLLQAHVPVDLVINTTKVKDGTDFTYNGVNYKGGPFIVQAQYRNPTVNALISTWQTTYGVVGITTTSPVTVPLYTTFWNLPRWTLDKQNGGIATNFFSNANIPATAYGGSSSSGWKLPSQLTCCDEIFVMPHADPTWATHSNLYFWNETCKGAIWLGCHAGSALMDMFNPADVSQQTNFLAVKNSAASGTGPYYENALVLWGHHSGGSPPYSYAYPADPIMQFMGTMDAAQQNGSEQIYMPVKPIGGVGGTWYPGAKVYVWDDTQVNVPTISPGPAATLVSGRGFDDPNRGRVMLEASHNISGTGTANIAAQRAFFNFSFLAVSEKAVLPSITDLPTTLYSGQPYTISAALPSGANPINYTYSWTSSCGGTFVPNNTSQTITFTPAVFANPTACTISVEIADNCGRVTFDTHSVTVQCNLQVATTITNPCSSNPSGGSIAMTITNGSAPYGWTWTRTSPSGGPVSGSGTTIPNLIAGTYSVTVTSSIPPGSGNGCPATFQVTLTQSPLINITATPVPVSCYGGSNGAINVSVSGGIPGYTFDWADLTGTNDPQNRSGLSTVTYSLTVTDSKGCTATATTTVSQPTAMVITPSVTPVLCNGSNTGAISLGVTGGTGAKTYAWNDGASTQNRTNLFAGTYSVTVTDANNCKQTATGMSVTEPSALTVTATATEIPCYGVTSTITVIAGGGTGSITYSINGGSYQQGITFIVSASASPYTITVKDGNNCTKSTTILVTQPPLLTLSTVVTRPTCPPDAQITGKRNDGAIDLSVTGGTPGFTYSWIAGGTGSIPLGQQDDQDLIGIVAGTYSVTVTDYKGCQKSTSVTLNYLNPNPVNPGTINH